jgi:hypothetical protein
LVIRLPSTVKIQIKRLRPDIFSLSEFQEGIIAFNEQSSINLWPADFSISGAGNGEKWWPRKRSPSVLALDLRQQFLSIVQIPFGSKTHRPGIGSVFICLAGGF